MAAPPPTTSSLVFKVHRREPELIRPAKPTPHEFKDLSDIDDQEGIRIIYMRAVSFYRYSPSMQGKDPVKIVREALAKTLVFYHPMAGRLREGPNRKLRVECNGEGVLFIEADADVTLEQFGVAPQPPYPCMDELLFDVPGSAEIVNCPIFLFQVTRLKCGGWILAIRFNHALCDGIGFSQFCLAVSEVARGEEVPSILPVWERHLFSASDPPKVTHQHLEYIDTAPNAAAHPTSKEEEELVDRSFAFGPKQFSALRSLAPPGRHSRNEILTACLWKCRTIALQVHPDEEVRLMSVVTARFRPEYNPPLPVGYYGNCFVLPVALTTAGNLIQNPIGFALDLVKKAKAQFSREYVKSAASFLALNGRPHFVTGSRTFTVADVKHIGEEDFGWGKAVAAGTADAGSAAFPGCCYLMPITDENGEKGILFSLSLPPPAMERFDEELQLMLHPTTGSKLVKSSL